MPTEAEWEYAARSGGRDQKYPWGNEVPTCERAVMVSNYTMGCGSGGTMPVCSKPDGNTKQGLCDMAGNVSEWARDTFHPSYNGAPTDGKAWEEAGSAQVLRVMRGGIGTTDLRADWRNFDRPDRRDRALGFRVAR